MVVEVDGVERSAYADVGMVGGSLVGDEVVVNTEALDLELGSGGSDVVVVNLTRGLDGKGDASRHVMKLNYSPMQTGVDPVEPECWKLRSESRSAYFQLHGQLAPAVWAAAQERPGVKIGYVQSGGGALPGALSTTVAELRTRGSACRSFDCSAGLRRRGRGDVNDRRSARRAHRTRLGLRDRRSGAGHHRLWHRARPWRNDRP